MITNLDKFVAFLSEYGITAHEFMLPYMLYLDEKVEKEGKEKYPNDPSEGTPIANLYRYSENCRGWSASQLQRLEEKGLIENNNPIIVTEEGTRKKVSPDMMRCTQLFRERIFAPETRWEEFVEVYPSMVPNFNDPNGPMIPLMSVGEPGAWEALENFYNKVVKTKVLHEEIISLVRWGNKKGYINMGISKFVSSRHWETLRLQRKRDNSSDDINQAVPGVQQA